MASDRAYAAEMVRCSRAKAIEDSAPDQAGWATKLERAMANPAASARPTQVAMTSQADKQLLPSTRTALHQMPLLIISGHAARAAVRVWPGASNSAR